MALHPIAVVDQVIEEYRSYLSTEFRASDPKLRQALEDALDRPGFLAQEPFFQARRPFKSGKPWRDLGLELALAQVMEARSGAKTAYLHQSEAITHLLSPDATPLAVTTGTGSGKTECFLLPVIQNAIQDSIRFNRSGLTALLIYPMNALANDQEERILEYLQKSGHTHVRVARYDRSTKQEVRDSLRKNPPHLLLTNYMMLEYLLLRPADRVALFANHRCRFVVLDEVHTYRGSLGANIALLYRRLTAHLRHAQQDWNAENPQDPQRFPALVPVATSATIKSVDEEDHSPEEITRLRDEAVQEFLSKITGEQPKRFRVIGESIRELEVPAQARWPQAPVDIPVPAYQDGLAVRQAIARLAGLPPDTELEQSVPSAAILWKLNDLLARRPLSVRGLVERILQEVPERQGADPAAVRQEVETALVAGAAIPDGMEGALRLRTHRFIRGGWQFHRCVDPACGKLYPMGEERCSACGKATAPLYLCRSCGVDTLRFRGGEDPTAAPLEPNDSRTNEGEWVLYSQERRAEEEDDLIEIDTDRQLRRRPVLPGSFDPATRQFSGEEGAYSMRVVLAPARNQCLVCGAFAGAGNILTPVALGTSAAVRVLAEGLVEGLAEQHAHQPEHDRKERLLIFADSRQDAAHQARFITYAGRYDRMRRRLVRILQEAGEPLSIDRSVQQLMVRGVEHHDNPCAEGYNNPEFLPQGVQDRAKAWEEAPLLDDLAVSAGYRATVFNLGLVGVRYQKLDAWVEKEGESLANELGVSKVQLLHLSRCLLDDMRRRAALSRPLLIYHPGNPNCPEEFKRDADWERRVKTAQGYACDEQGHPLGRLDRNEVPPGININNCWRKVGAGGRSPRLERVFREMLMRMGGVEGTETLFLDTLQFLLGGLQYIKAVKLFGYRQSHALLQINADAIHLELLQAEDRFRCSICNVRLPWVVEGAPCPACQGIFRPWPAGEMHENRYVQRILKKELLPLVAGEHTAQITSDDRLQLEEDFKGPPEKSPVNVLACSPTLEMGIDVGGLDAVVMRNVPPRPDNYAQRGGRAGRRSRVGIVLGYARSTPHDGYFYDKPGEMIAGEVPAPGVGMGNRDVVLRHLHAIVFGAAEPGLSGQMGDYITLQGGLKQEAVDQLIVSLEVHFEHAAILALEAWGPEILGPAGLTSREALLEALGQLPDRVRDLFDRVRYQILQLEETIKRWSELGRGDRMALNAMDLKRKLLGIRGERDASREADDRTPGHPLRRFAEFGILPGYEFPSEPCTLRMWNDRNEDDPISVERRFGLAQYQIDARVYARGHRWRVIGLDTASPWNPKTPEPSWVYSVCKHCGLRYDAQQQVRCPRCKSDATVGNGFPGHDFGGFLALRDDTPVLEEEDRFAIASLVQIHPQWNGQVKGRYLLSTGWHLQLRLGEEIRWLNEWRQPSESDKKEERPYLHNEGRGFYLCPVCGKALSMPEESDNRRGRRKAKTDGKEYGHASDCERVGQAPRPLAITTRSAATTLRMVVYLPTEMTEDSYQRWGYSLGYALRIGIRQLYMLDGPEIDFALEPMWEEKQDKHHKGALTFIDPAVGGSGFLERTAEELHLVARRTLDHLEHPGCESACYRCLKSYNNQRHHQYLSWPEVIPELEQLGELAPQSIQSELGDAEDPGPWLEAYEAGVGSPLELKFLRLFEQQGLEVEKQVPVSPNHGESAISVADFVVKGKRIAIYVDGAAFHRGMRLRRDRVIRQRLREGDLGWTVVEVRAGDLSKGAGLVSQIRQSQ